MYIANFYGLAPIKMNEASAEGGGSASEIPLQNGGPPIEVFTCQWNQIAATIRGMQVDNAFSGTSSTGIRWSVGVDFFKAWEISAVPVVSIDINPNPRAIQTMAGMPLTIDPLMNTDEAALIDARGNVVKIIALNKERIGVTT